MREIKFRGRRKNSSEWVYGAFLAIPKLCSYIYDVQPDGQATRYLVDEDTVGQFTGLKDADGCEIYEGDVLNNLYGHLGVSYKQEWAAFVACGVDKTGYYHEYLLDEIVNTPVWMSKIKVIGNVHDNPELLEQRP